MPPTKCSKCCRRPDHIVTYEDAGEIAEQATCALHTYEVLRIEGVARIRTIEPAPGRVEKPPQVRH